MNDDVHVRGRYAPSPTGPLHLGNARTALIAWVQVRLQHGVFVMRMEDLDRPRNVPGSAEQILDDLRWLGLDWDEGPDVGGDFGPYIQTERDDIYTEVFDRLIEEDRVFRCWCSRKDIREAASAPHAGSPVYPGTCRDLTPKQMLEVQQRKPDKVPAWRYRATEREICLVDQLQGEFCQHLTRDVGDFVLRRADHIFAYQLAVVVDDIAMGITDVVRGADLLESTPRQIALYHALGASVPRFWHVPLMLDGAGIRMSKRDGSESLQALREAGRTPEQVIGMLAASIGWCEIGEELSAPTLLEQLRGLDDPWKGLRS